EIYTILRSELYKPKVIIEYNRIAYVSSLGTRITFDLNIKKSNEFKSYGTINRTFYDTERQ
ncbi:MAG: VTC domain-containing protein, partial [Bacteroidetes bacterium]|nr:VTC domain-containing protein [Bacteroidota bacterium]